jgi:hypothetical protein
MAYTDTTIRLKFPQLFKGAFAEIRNPLLMPWGEKRKLAESATDDGNPSAAMAKASDLAASFITAWNIPPLDNGEVKQPPLSAEDLENVPSVVVEAVMEKFNSATAVDPPNGSI